MDNSEQVQRINWRQVTAFYVVAVLVSAPFRLNLIHLGVAWPLPFGLNIFYSVLRGIGPAIGFFVVFFILKSNVSRKISLLGSSKLNLLSIVIMPIGLAITGVNNEIGFNRNYYGLLVGVMLVLYALGEEFGWRGYLQQALSPLSPSKRIIIVATLWYIWHLNFLVPGIGWQIHGIHYLSLLLGSWGLLKISESTCSILFAAAVHLSFNLLSDVNIIIISKLIILICSAAVWTVLIIVVSRQQKLKHAKNLQ